MSKHEELPLESLSESISCMLHAFSDDGRRAAIRDLASRSAALEGQAATLTAVCDCGAPLTSCASCAVADYQANGDPLQARVWALEAQLAEKSGEGRPDAAMALAVQVATLTAERAVLLDVARRATSEMEAMGVRLSAIGEERDAATAKLRAALVAMTAERDGYKEKAIDWRDESDRNAKTCVVAVAKLAKLGKLVTDVLGTDVERFLAEVKS